MFARKIKFARRIKCLTKKQIADYLNVNQEVVDSWERGENLPDFYKLVELSVLLGLSIEVLLGIID
ncbi:helix-turn-helix domain-containing protein [Floricoccus penangensis]|uniref:helix-turn-helix domain-containing protein n=1 Tax=Floricoccus penangensis TaxID=1859475 RepID=UPI002040AFE2|nr:helix-turn-helix domain-containing protein [Floricoccus penangensis]URZ87314.1 helix-turn-helix domain-containing protein [Floricoccus penangensis]